MREEIKNLNISTVLQKFYSNCKTILSYYLKCKEKTDCRIQGLQRQTNES